MDQRYVQNSSKLFIKSNVECLMKRDVQLDGEQFRTYERIIRKFGAGAPTKTYISTLSTLTPHGSVATSNDVCIACEMASLSDKISARFLVPRIFLRVVMANNLVELLKPSNYLSPTSNYTGSLFHHYL